MPLAPFSKAGSVLPIPCRALHEATGVQKITRETEILQGDAALSGKKMRSEDVEA